MPFFKFSRSASRSQFFKATPTSPTNVYASLESPLPASLQNRPLLSLVEARTRRDIVCRSVEECRVSAEKYEVSPLDRVALWAKQQGSVTASAFEGKNDSADYPPFSAFASCDSWSSFGSPEEHQEEEVISAMSSTETLVASPAPAEKEAKAYREAVAAILEALISEIPVKPKPIRRTMTLVPLAIAAQRSDIKYRAEGFEMV
ncbi:hypothetical protein EW026_g3336 [Hermanssonia centrifuga]|uniref:Uncharacterized protein n=1 Tax=Hermanssonia centrifuga TaxID=98765 RepID=A0A4S4KKF7_9APHY|nr:hypothetical protein EW026_g3336 [Hermanssonia centrifuga]